MSIPETKICKRCGVEKTQECFSRNKVKGNLYLYPYCKPCAVVLNSERQKLKPKTGPKLSKSIKSDTKICNVCGIEKTHSEFSLAAPKKGDRFGLMSACKPCRAAINNQRHKSNPIKAKSQRGNWYRKNKDHVSAYNKASREADPQLFAARNREWTEANLPHCAAKQTMKKARQLEATPKWLSPIQHAQIREFYELAHARRTQTGQKFHVDHIVPLDGENFRGLHVPWNLQVLSAFENISKKNRAPRELAHMFWDTT